MKIEYEKYSTITMEELKIWTEGHTRNWMDEYLLDILTGKYDLNDAREDCLSFRKEVKND